jgi:hypothetical protein
MPHDGRPARAVDDQLAVIDGLCVLPFPAHEVRPEGADRWGGPGYHLALLRESRDFWEDRGEDVVEAAEREIEADLDTLSAVLTDRWGEPETVDLLPFLGLDSPDPGFSAPEPLAYLAGVAGSMRVWRPTAVRWIALAIGQADPEWPIQLLAASGGASLPAR